MVRFKSLIISLIFITMPSLFSYPHNDAHIEQAHSRLKEHIRKPEKYHLATYDEIMNLFRDIETGRKDFRPKDFVTIDKFLAYLSKKGVIANTPTALALNADIADLLYSDLAYAQGDTDFTISHAIWHGDDYYAIDPVSWNDCWKKTKSFFKKYKKEIIIGAVIVVATAAIVIAVVAPPATAAVVTAAGAAISQTPSADPKIVTDVELSQIPYLQQEIDHQANIFKETIVKDGLLSPTESFDQLSWETTGKVLGAVFTYSSIEKINYQLTTSTPLSQEIQTIRSFYTSEPPNIQLGHEVADHFFGYSLNAHPKTSFQDYSYQALGMEALHQGYYTQAVAQFNQAINTNPQNPFPYLYRSQSYFELGDYDNFLRDFQSFSSQTTKDIPFSLKEFTIGLSQGLPLGIYESGEGLILFLAETIAHPIHTGGQVIEAIRMLKNLATEEEWQIIAQALAPEVHQLVTEWDILPSQKRGELAGYALGKYGADILTPAAVVKLGSISAKGAKQLAAACKNLKIAQETLLLETAAQIGNSAKVAEILKAGEETSFLAKELSFTSHEIGQLKRAGQLENVLQNKLHHLSVPKQESITLFSKAEKELKSKKGFLPEYEARKLIHQTGIPTFPRPHGVPENFRVKLSNNGAGMKYVHPINEETYVRVMPGKIHSEYPHQQKPYVIQMKDGKTLDKFGKIVLRDSPEAHIPLEEYIYIGE